jgi:hypothetical protein
MRNAQVSNEMIMMYGFVVLVIVIFALVLPNVTVLKKGLIANDRCQTGGSLSCTEYKITRNSTETDVQVLLRNTHATYIRNVTIYSYSCNSTLVSWINNSESAWFNLSKCSANEDAGDSMKLNFMIGYYSDRNITHKESGFVEAVVEER